MKFGPWEWPKRIFRLLEVPEPEPEQTAFRIRVMERDVVLPVKVAMVGALVYFLYFPRWITDVASTREVAVEAVESFLAVYIAANLVVAAALLAMRRMSLALVQWIVFTNCLVDGLFLAAMTLVTGGFDSILYWIFLGLIIRNAVSVPRATSQLALNFSISMCYMLAGGLDVAISQIEAGEYDENTRRALDLGLEENPTEPFLMRMVMLWLMTLCCYGMCVLLERQRRAAEEMREFAARQQQLRAAGRLAAEIAHQIKNPLGIINNAAYSMQRALARGRNNVSQQLEIIREEVERSDRIITQLIGYARLTEGRVEKLDVTQELDRAIAQVFPEGAGYETVVERHYGADFPALMMQREHLSEIFVNLLLNAREALEGRGRVTVNALNRDDHSIEVVITDDGPGIEPDKQGRIFEAYYTSKEKGSGLGLSIARHNAELYGGSIRIESTPGRGASFFLLFPAKTLAILPQP